MLQLLYKKCISELYFQKYIQREKLIKVGHQINVLKNQIAVLKQQME